MKFEDKKFLNGMTAKLFRHSAGTVLAAVLLMAGCATQGVNQTQTPELAVKAADAELANGQRDKAIAILMQNAKDNPTSALPWLKIANIWFDAANYPSSILAANEALQREPSNQEAKSLLVVGGVRIAANAVSGLRTSNAVNSSARYEAENLTSAIRNALGEKNLVAAPGATDNKTANTTAHGRTLRNKKHAAAEAQTSGTTQASQASSGSGSSDPFKSLK
jgi:tetratricopeptide (TPR) repeat protein